MSKKVDLESKTSDKKGLAGLFEKLLRQFTTLIYLATMLPVYLFGVVVLGSSLIPAVALFRFTTETFASHAAWIQNTAFAFSLAAGYFLYGFTLVCVAPFINFTLRLNLKEWRGNYYSAETLKWFLHNGLTYLVRFTFLEFVTPSPLGIIFYKMMGMKIGRGVIINSTWISDPSLISLGHKTTIGGSVTIVGHYGQGGLLVVSPVKIGDKCTIGLKATIMGGCVIGDGAKILPHSVLLPKTIVPAGETWGGVPAQKIDLKKMISDVKSEAA